MAGPGKPVLSWDSLHKGAEVRFYASSTWKKGHIAGTYPDSASVAWDVGSTVRVTRIYDLRNLRLPN